MRGISYAYSASVIRFGGSGMELDFFQQMGGELKLK